MLGGAEAITNIQQNPRLPNHVETCRKGGKYLNLSLTEPRCARFGSADLLEAEGGGGRNQNQINLEWNSIRHKPLCCWGGLPRCLSALASGAGLERSKGREGHDW